MSQTIRAHFDGKVFVPDEPVHLPVNQPLDLSFVPAAQPAERNGVSPTPQEIERRLQALDRLRGTFSGPVLSDEALRRENLYEDRW